MRKLGMGAGSQLGTGCPKPQTIFKLNKKWLVGTRMPPIE